MTEEDGCQDDADDAEHVRSQVDAKLQFHEIKIEVNILDIQDFIMLRQRRQDALQGRDRIQRFPDDTTEDAADDEKDKKEQQAVLTRGFHGLPPLYTKDTKGPPFLMKF